MVVAPALPQVRSLVSSMHLPIGEHVASTTELDLVIQRGARKIGVEIKFSSAPKPARGFWQALEDLQIDRAYVVAPVPRRYPLAERVEVMPVADVVALLQ